MRLFTATLATETNTFSPLPTSLDNYKESVFFRPGEHPVDAPRMVAHDNDGIKASMGEVALTPLKGPLGLWPVNVLVMFYLPWPKGAPTAKAAIAGDRYDLEAEKARCLKLLDDFAANPPGSDWPVHIIAGRLTGEQYSRTWGSMRA